MVAPILSAGTHVIVGDGRKALILFNEGTAEHPSLTVEMIFTHPDLPTRALGAERPGRVFASVGPRSAATDEPDLHQRAEDQFVRDIVAGLVELAKREKLKNSYLLPRHGRWQSCAKRSRLLSLISSLLKSRRT